VSAEASTTPTATELIEATQRPSRVLRERADTVDRQRRVSAETFKDLPPTPEEMLKENRDNSYLTQLAMRSVDRLHGLLGAKACFEGHPVARAMRDIHTIATHVTLNWDRTAVGFAKNALKLDSL
jgi:Acyl-CoA dehydrogenase, C-terminal domain